MDDIFKMLGKSLHLEIIMLYHKNRDFFDNITGLTEKLGKSHVTVRKVVKDLLDVGILKESNIGMSRVLTLNENGKYTGPVMRFLDEISQKDRDKHLESILNSRMK